LTWGVGFEVTTTVVAVATGTSVGGIYPATGVFVVVRWQPAMNRQITRVIIQDLNPTVEGCMVNTR
jgi:hypothetical protein